MFNNWILFVSKKLYCCRTVIIIIIIIIIILLLLFMYSTTGEKLRVFKIQVLLLLGT